MLRSYVTSHLLFYIRSTKPSKKSLLFFFCFLLPSITFAAGGLDKVNTFMEHVLVILRGVSIAVVTIAIIWAGYKFLFRHSEIGECLKILGGGLLIGCASEIAQYILN